MCADSVNDAVNRITAGTLCYDNSIVSHVIREIDSKLSEHQLGENSVVESMFQYGMELTVNLMKKVQDQWEKENSVPAKLESNKENLRWYYFMMVSNGVAKTKLFATYMADLLEEHIIPAFENDMVQRTCRRIRNERWLYDARYMQKHMDLHLIDLLERNQLDQVLDYLRNPQWFYADVLHLLIAQKVPHVDEQWRSFKNRLRDAISKAAAVEVDKEKAQTFVDHLRKEFLDGYLQSEILGSAFRIDCSGEYEDCDNEEKEEFQKTCLKTLIEVLEKQEAIKDKNKFSKQLSPKVVQYMKDVNDKAALPRCDAFCQLCKSLCIEAANHDTQDRPHDAVHQPGGVAGLSYIHTDELVHMTCSQSYEDDRTFQLDDSTVSYLYREYAKVFPGWRNPRINEELPLREYILTTYNNEIAKKYNEKPSTQIPPSRTLSDIKEQLEREIAD
ncbi:uncharacterized protein LOC124190679 [Daphnia pulex]|uniref:uncharacterized protein LOC124190679 n=1 Tax=Daphnia pulex TaxID=6669 RepID=UPI001EDEA9E4|nr:uncharacterized protein LOC124190679 [Daphnia pulex]